ncbi:MAG: hypothetical protein C5B51_28545 [Terriglobia bacterium]|nr:MAG: hypothetical protein C5B51_28545 [Terriglobia bacterium]
MVKPLQAAFGGGPADAILARLDASGSQLTFSTYLGGSGEDYGNGVAVDRLGRVYLAGTTNSTNFPIKNAIQPVFRGVYDGFVAKLNVTASALDYSTYLGGSGDDEVWAMSVDQPDRPWIIGTTTSADFPLTTDALQSIAGGGLDGFITELNLAGTALKFSTYFGGSNDDYMEGIFLDHNGGIYLTGTTLSSNFPTKNALQPALGGSSDAFVMKIAER